MFCSHNRLTICSHWKNSIIIIHLTCKAQNHTSRPMYDIVFPSLLLSTLVHRKVLKASRDLHDIWNTSVQKFTVQLIFSLSNFVNFQSKLGLRWVLCTFPTCWVPSNTKCNPYMKSGPIFHTHMDFIYKCCLGPFRIVICIVGM